MSVFVSAADVSVLSSDRVCTPHELKQAVPGQATCHRQLNETTDGWLGTSLPLTLPLVCRWQSRSKGLQRLSTSSSS